MHPFPGAISASIGLVLLPHHAKKESERNRFGGIQTNGREGTRWSASTTCAADASTGDERSGSPLTSGTPSVMSHWANSFPPAMKIFISSTSSDLQSERESVRRVFEDLKKPEKSLGG